MSNKLLTCIQEQNIEMLQSYINNNEMGLKNKNLVQIMFTIYNQFWQKDNDINIDFFESLLKNYIPLNSTLSKENKTTAISKIISDIDNNRNAYSHICSTIKISDKATEHLHEKELKTLSKYNEYEEKSNQMLLLLIKYGANPNTILEYELGLEKISILEYADIIDNKELFILLVKQGADINKEYFEKSRYGLSHTPLSKAIYNQDLDNVKLLLEYNANINICSKYNIFQNFQSYYISKAESKILKQDTKYIQLSNLPLYKKVEGFENNSKGKFYTKKENSPIETLKHLVKYKLDINFTIFGKSIYDLAVESSDIDTIQFCIENSIDYTKYIELVSNTNKDDQDITQKAVASNSYRKDKKTEQDKDENTVSYALEKRDFDKFSNLVTDDILSKIPIIDFIKEDYSIEFIEKALRSEANINFKDRNGKTALILASKNNKTNIVKLLLNSDAKLDIEDNTSKNALQYTSKNIELTKIILTYFNTTKAGRLKQKLKKFSGPRLQYTNHDWDVPNLNYEKFMEDVLIGWNEIKDDLKILLCDETYQNIEKFLFEKNLGENDSDGNIISWGDNITIGWSSKEIKNAGNKPHLYKLNNNRGQFKEFKNVMDYFKSLFVVKQDVVGKSILEKFEKLDDDHSYNFTLDTDQLVYAKIDNIFTDVAILELALSTILSEINDRVDDGKNNVKVTIEQVDSNPIVLKIIHVGSTSKSEADKLILAINESGGFSSIYEKLSCICDWSIDTICSDGKRYRIDYLFPQIDNNKPHCQEIKNDIEGFTHILRFYI